MTVTCSKTSSCTIQWAEIFLMILQLRMFNLLKVFLLTCFKSDKKLLASLAGAEAAVLVRQSIPGTGNEAHWAFVSIREMNYSKATPWAASKDHTKEQQWPWAAEEPLERGWKRLLVARAITAGNPQEKHRAWAEKLSAAPKAPARISTCCLSSQIRMKEAFHKL